MHNYYANNIKYYINISTTIINHTFICFYQKYIIYMHGFHEELYRVS